MFNLNDLVEIFQNNSSIAIPISLLINIGIALVGALPSVFVTGANIVFFGSIKGFFISLLGETIGAYITFTIYRLGLKKRINKLTDKNKLLNRLANSEGKKAGLLIFEGRVIPFLPSGLVTLAGSISNVDSLTFTIATFVGKMPSIALEALVSYQIINAYNNWIRLGITIIGLVVLKFTIGRKNSS
ncbi:VTT domain-containing protein [Clostridiaceae bacterium M8S5]|nr:VTT domain-containing protein [Clostridiaceae bacterium M8S5]